MDIEEFCGMTEYGTSEPGIGGRIKERPEDFVVEEIPINVGEDGDYLICWLEKRNMTTFDAISKISLNLGVSKNKIGYAGLKDRRAITRQLVSFQNLNEKDLKKVNSERIDLKAAGRLPRPLKPGDLNGNRFDITVRNIELSIRETEKRLGKLRKGAGRNGVPNYFGIQRFGGDRPVSHLVGRKLLRRNFRKAVLVYLTKTFPTENEKNRKARKRLSKGMNFSDALEYFPKYLGYERKILERLSTGPPSRKREWLKALSALPKGLRRLFVHSYQSYVFNSSLSSLLSNGEMKNFPAKVVGYSTKLSDSKFDRATKEILKSDEIKPEDFKFRESGELSSKGSVRAALIEDSFDIVSIGEDEKNPGETKAEIKFSLNPGSYATVFLREIMK